MNYKKYSDEEILESYSTNLDYSNEVDKDLMREIENRGGIVELKKNINKRNIVSNEVKRINKEVFYLYKNDTNPEKIRSSITSDILSKDQLENTIDTTLKNIKQHIKDTSINSRTIISSFTGLVISSFLGAIIWCSSIIYTGKMYYILTPGILIISYVIIRILTKQSKNNVLVFIATFTSAFIAIPVGILFYKLLTK